MIHNFQFKDLLTILIDKEANFAKFDILFLLQSMFVISYKILFCEEKFQFVVSQAQIQNNIDQ